MSPTWWQAYNRIKHHRDQHFLQANLENALNALAGLFVMVLLFYEEPAGAGKLAPNPLLFRPANDYSTMVWDTEFAVQYPLPARDEKR